MAEVKIGNVPVGDAHPVAFMAEMGTFYNKDISLAIQIAEKAIDAGSDIIKTEILHNANVVLDDPSVTCTYNFQGGQRTENYRKLIERKIVPLEKYRELFSYIRSRNKPFVASVYDLKGVDFLCEEGGSGIKLWRSNYNNIPLIRHAAKTGLPMIFDMVNLYPEQMLMSVRTALEAGAGGVIVNYHPGKNPSSAADHNLRVFDSYKRLLGCPIGLSCHYRGEDLLYAAVGAGVNLIEKGVFDNPDKDEQNVITATSLSVLADVIVRVKNSSVALGSGEIRVHTPQDQSLLYGLVLSRDVEAGEKLSPDNLSFAFPQRGISVQFIDQTIGSVFRQSGKAGQPVYWSDLEFPKK